MSTPPDPEKGQPYPGQQGQPTYGTGYGGVQYPYPAGDGPTQQNPYPGQPYPGQAYPGQAPQGGSPYPYNPYAQASPYGQSPYGGYPAGMGDKPSQVAARPKIMIVALLLKVLAALPYLAGGALVLAGPQDPSILPPELVESPEVVAAGFTPDTLLSAFRVIAVVFVVLAIIFILFAVLAFMGRNWARILVAVMTSGFALILLFLAFTGLAADPASAAILLVPVALAVAGVVILFLAPSNVYFSRPRG